MNKFKRKSLYLALAAGLGAVGAAGSANAVNVNDRGLGQVLIYPYYTVRNDLITALSVVNTHNETKAVKVRFTEGKNSREVLDFNLYLSPHDEWTGAVVATTDGAKLVTTDKSCTSPAIPAAGQSFVNYAYSGAVVEGIQQSGGDGETASLDRTREGYFEIIEMGVITNTALITAITHVNGVPGNCAIVQAATMNMGVGTGTSTGGTTDLAAAPSGGLAGTASLINVASGVDFGYDPTALAAFSAINIWAPPGSIKPDLSTANPFTSVVFKAGAAIGSVWLTGDEAVNATIIHDNLINEYVLDTATASATNWVVTMPTKRYSVPVDASPIAQVVYTPFTQQFYTGGACEPVTLNYYDREERNIAIVDFSPPAPGGGTSLCWETTVVTFNSSNVLGSTNAVNVAVNFENGWLNMGFTATGLTMAGTSNQVNFANGVTSAAGAAAQSMADTAGLVYIGLPTIGFALHNYTNGAAAPGVMATYGGNFNHKFTTNIGGVATD